MRAISKWAVIVAVVSAMAASQLTFSRPAIGRLPVVSSIPEAFASADLVALVEIVQRVPKFGGGDFCGLQIAAEAQEIYKNNSDHQIGVGESFRFGSRTVDLDPSGVYLVFVRYEDNWKDLYQQHVATFGDPGFSPDAVQQMYECDGLLPGFEQHLVLAVQDGYIEMSELSALGVPDSLQRYPLRDGYWRLKADDVFAYLKDLNDSEQGLR